jgi:hypothetical protein
MQPPTPHNPRPACVTQKWLLYLQLHSWVHESTKPSSQRVHFKHPFVWSEVSYFDVFFRFYQFYEKRSHLIDSYCRTKLCSKSCLLGNKGKFNFCQKGNLGQNCHPILKNGLLCVFHALENQQIFPKIVYFPQTKCYFSFLNNCKCIAMCRKNWAKF